MRVADNVDMLEISAIIMGKTAIIHPALLWDEEDAVLVDTGFPGQTVLFREAITLAGIPFKRLNGIIITHQDLDHIGSLPALLQEALRKVTVMASAAEQPYIQGEKRLLRFPPEVVERMINTLPPEMPEERRTAFRSVLENPPSAHVDTTVADGEELPYCGGITVIATPGHTPGHICLYHRLSNTLIAGDALTIVDGRLQPSDPRLALNSDEAAMSLKKLTRYDIARVICYHGGLYARDVNQRIAEIAQGERV